MVEVPDWPGLRVSDVGLRVTDTPLGAPETDRLITCEEPEPLADVTVIVALVDVLPDRGMLTVALEGLTDTVKSLT